MNYKDAALAVLALNPPKSGYCLKPFAAFTKGLRKAGWEPGYLDLRIPASTVPGRGAGKLVTQPVAVFPASWIRELCKRAGVGLKQIIELKVETEWADAEFVQPVGGRPKNLGKVKEFSVRLPAGLADRILEVTGQSTMSGAVKKLAEPIFLSPETIVS